MSSRDSLDRSGNYGGVPLWFNGRLYRWWSKFIHRRGYHYAPKEYPIEQDVVTARELGEAIHWRHWCKWCGLRGKTLEIPPHPIKLKGDIDGS